MSIDMKTCWLHTVRWGRGFTAGFAHSESATQIKEIAMRIAGMWCRHEGMKILVHLVLAWLIFSFLWNGANTEVEGKLQYQAVFFVAELSQLHYLLDLNMVCTCDLSKVVEYTDLLLSFSRPLDYCCSLPCLQVQRGLINMFGVISRWHCIGWTLNMTNTCQHHSASALNLSSSTITYCQNRSIIKPLGIITYRYTGKLTRKLQITIVS